MPNWFKGNSQPIGYAPIVMQNRIIDGEFAMVLSNIKVRNLTHAVNCSIIATMINGAQRRGMLRLDKDLIGLAHENIRIKLAFAAACSISLMRIPGFRLSYLSSIHLKGFSMWKGNRYCGEY